MDIHKRSLQIGLWVLLCALVFRLGGGAADKLASFLSRPEVASTLLFLETGRVVRAAEPEMPTEPPEETVPETVAPTVPEPEPVVFTAEDVGKVKVNNQAGKSMDVSALMQSPLSWDLTQDEPTVLIYHTHGTEGYADTSGYRSRDNNYNMVSIGAAVVKRLTAAGISVIHDTVTHDYPSYDGSYASSRKSVQAYLAEYPSIRLVIDLHRDSMTDSAGKQIQTTVDGAAQMMLVVGAQAGNFQENTALAVKLHALLERQCPGIMRSLCVRPQRFNQDLLSGALLIELGAAGNTRQQALKSADILSDALLALAQGSVYQ
jgi:stage II sporulation protein P